jgi:hypothetical protein
LSLPLVPSLDQWSSIIEFRTHRLHLYLGRDFDEPDFRSRHIKLETDSGFLVGGVTYKSPPAYFDQGDWLHVFRSLDLHESHVAPPTTPMNEYRSDQQLQTEPLTNRTLLSLGQAVLPTKMAKIALAYKQTRKCELISISRGEKTGDMDYEAMREEFPEVGVLC